MFYVNENELMHYGVLGMKWGVRRSPEELARSRSVKAEKYKEKEADKLFNRIQKANTKDIIKSTKQANKLNESITKYGGDSPKVQKMANKYLKNRAQRIYEIDKMREERIKVMNMSIDDVSAEKKAVGKAYANSALLTIGTATVASLTGSPFYLTYIPNTKQIKTNKRLTIEEQRKIAINAVNEARRDLHYED